MKQWDYYIHYYYVLHGITTYYYIYYYDDCDSLGTYPQITIFMGKVKTQTQCCVFFLVSGIPVSLSDRSMILGVGFVQWVDVEVNDSIIFRARHDLAKLKMDAGALETLVPACSSTVGSRARQVLQIANDR